MSSCIVYGSIDFYNSFEDGKYPFWIHARLPDLGHFVMRTTLRPMVSWL
jgi:hypothetical protein